MSEPEFQFTAVARLDLLEIWNYLADEASLDVADKVLNDIEGGIRALVRRAGLGHRRPDLTDRPLLFYLVHSYLIVYRERSKPLAIVRVLHAARDVKQLLQD